MNDIRHWPPAPGRVDEETSMIGASRLFILSLLLVGIFTPLDVEAYSFIYCQPVWESGDIPVGWRLNDACSGDLAFGDCEEAIKAGFNTWTAASCSYMEWFYEGTTASGPESWGEEDGVNLLVWEEGDWPEELTDVVAATIPIFYDCNPARLVDADIIFNGVEFTWGVNGEAGRMDVANIATHEIGHALGLDHSDDTEATMYYATVFGETKRRTLEEDDINGVCALYPKDHVPVEVGDPCDDNCLKADNYYCETRDGLSICTHDCETHADCPAHYICLAMDGNDACWPEGSKTLGEPCLTDADCERNLLCRANGHSAICTTICQGRCPDGYECRQSSAGDWVCLPGDTDPGDTDPAAPKGDRDAGVAGFVSQDDQGHLIDPPDRASPGRQDRADGERDGGCATSPPPAAWLPVLLLLALIWYKR